MKNPVGVRSCSIGPTLGLSHLAIAQGPLARERPQIYFLLFFFFFFFLSLLRRPKELSNTRDKDKTNLNKLILQINVLLITSNSNRKMLKIL